MKRHYALAGDLRVVRKFAWYPIRTDDGYIVWLRFFFQKEIFKMFPPEGPIAGLCYFEWVRVSRSTKPFADE